MPFYPWVQIIGILGLGFLIFEMGSEALIITIILIVGGIFTYWFYGRIRASREYALLHLIERITAKELTTYSLEAELKEIIRERENIVKDRFDHLVENAIVLDIDKTICVDEFFHIAAGVLSEKLNMESTAIFKSLLDREQENSTVLSPGLAIPHIIIEGEHKFDLLLVRCKGGINFSKNHPSIHAVFVLIGTKDERNFHLFALAAIAQIVQDTQFDKQWLNAKNKESLKDIVLLGKRKRF